MSHTFFVKFRVFKREFLWNHLVRRAQIFRDNWNCYDLSIRRDFILLASSDNDDHMVMRQKKAFSQRTSWMPFYWLYKAFSLTCSASMPIYWNKRNRLHKKGVQLPEDWFGTPTWPPFHCFGTPIWPPWRHVKTLYTLSSTVWETYLAFCSGLQAVKTMKNYKTSGCLREVLTIVLSQAKFVVLDRWSLVGPPSLKFFSKTPVESRPVPKQENNIFCRVCFC